MSRRKKPVSGLRIVSEKVEEREVPAAGNAPSNPAKRFSGRAAVVTLGCAKNQVDSEVMLGVLRQSGFEIVGDVSRADVAVINTCGFLQSAVKESIDCILDVATLKTRGQLRRLIVTGCAVDRFRDAENGGGSIEEALPEVDCFLSGHDLMAVGHAAGDGLPESRSALQTVLDQAARPYFLYDDSMPRMLSTPQHFAYVKISEGCNRPCTFCIIPKIRGTFRSRTIDSIAAEVRSLGAQGVKEVNLVAQDLTAFGSDSDAYSRGEYPLATLLRRLDMERSVAWVRLLYAYPLGVQSELLDALMNLPIMCRYLDLPLQHASETVLRAMQRPLGKFSPRSVVEFIRSKAPQLWLRTTFIVGFPGETEADIDALEAFIAEGHFGSVGVFTYSREEGTASFALEGHVPEEVKSERRARLMAAQQAVIQDRLSQYVGQVIPVLIDGTHEETELLLSGRAQFQAPEVDGSVIVNDVEEGLALPQRGNIVPVEIREVCGYDLVGCVVGCDTVIPARALASNGTLGANDVMSESERAQRIRENV